MAIHLDFILALISGGNAKKNRITSVGLKYVILTLYRNKNEWYFKSTNEEE